MRIAISNWSRRVAIMRQPEARCWSVKRGMGAWSSSIAGRRYAGRKSPLLASHRVLGTANAQVVGFRWCGANGCLRRIIRGARRHGKPHSKKRCGSRRRQRRWLCPPLHPNRSALRAPRASLWAKPQTGDAVGQARSNASFLAPASAKLFEEITRKEKTQNTKRGHFNRGKRGDILKEL